MYFTKVELHNFGIYKGTHEMCLTDQIGNRNITLVGGLNGRGKTTFHDSILIALYGKQALKYIQEKARSYDKLLLDHINKHATDEETYDNELSSQQSEAKLYSDKIIVNLHQQILERLINCGLSQTDLRAVQDIINDVLVGHIPESATKETIKNMSATSMMLYQRLIAEIFQSFTQRINSLVNHVDAQESELMSLDAHLGAADEKTLAMQLFDALKSVEGEKALADAEYQRQLDSIESLKRQREMLVAKRIQLIKAIAEKEQANDDNARIVKYAAMSIEVLREFKVRLQREKVAKLSSTATKCFRELVEKDSLVSEIKIDPSTLDVTILDLDGNELLKSQLSAGEQQMFAVAIVWALALTSGYKAPVIIDTPMARLDSSHRANFVTKYLPAASSQVMVLSTDEEVYGRYLDLVRDNVVDYYTLLYREEEQCTSTLCGKVHRKQTGSIRDPHHRRCSKGLPGNVTAHARDQWHQTLEICKWNGYFSCHA